MTPTRRSPGCVPRSASFIREPEGNGIAARFIRTLKENLPWVQHFASVAELVAALREFQRRYNDQLLIERQGYRTPTQVRSALCPGPSRPDHQPVYRQVG
jgi:hypothetical protein